MPEKRKLKRRQLVYYLKVLDQNSGELIGRLADITADGLMVFGPDRVPDHHVFPLQVELPESMGLPPVKLVAESRWSGKDVNPDFYAHGFKIVRISPRDLETISDLIDEYELPD